jgi:hypothetical protein
VWKINDTYAGGVPDCYYCDIGGQLFVEYKYVPKVPKLETTWLIPKLSGNQKLWLQNRHLQKVDVAVVLGTPEGAIVFTDLSWIQGIQVKKLNQNILSPKGIANIIQLHVSGKRTIESTHGTANNNGTRSEKSKATAANME